jgi:hypothetical protein
MSNVVFLAYNNDRLEESGPAMLACAICRNKAFSVLAPDDGFKILKCTACGQHLGRIGWAEEPA